MKKNILSDKLDELYKKEQYNHPIQTRPEPKAGITGEEPNEEDIGTTHGPSIADEDEIEKDLGKGNQSDIGNKGNIKDIGQKKKSKPKNWEFEGPRDGIEQED
jgi:hypothetical protein